MSTTSEIRPDQALDCATHLAWDDHAQWALAQGKTPIRRPLREIELASSRPPFGETPVRLASERHSAAFFWHSNDVRTGFSGIAALRCRSGGSAIWLSANDAWAEPLSVVLDNVRVCLSASKGPSQHGGEPNFKKWRSGGCCGYRHRASLLLTETIAGPTMGEGMLLFVRRVPMRRRASRKQVSIYSSSRFRPNELASRDSAPV
jgi:hypothetical protein